MGPFATESNLVVDDRLRGVRNEWGIDDRASDRIACVYADLVLLEATEATEAEGDSVAEPSGLVGFRHARIRHDVAGPPVLHDTPPIGCTPAPSLPGNGLAVRRDQAVARPVLHVSGIPRARARAQLVVPVESKVRENRARVRGAMRYLGLRQDSESRRIDTSHQRDRAGARRHNRRTSGRNGDTPGRSESRTDALGGSWRPAGEERRGRTGLVREAHGRRRQRKGRRRLIHAIQLLYQRPGRETAGGQIVIPRVGKILVVVLMEIVETRDSVQLVVEQVFEDDMQLLRPGPVIGLTRVGADGQRRFVGITELILVDLQAAGDRAQREVGTEGPVHGPVEYLLMGVVVLL